MYGFFCKRRLVLEVLPHIISKSAGQNSSTIHLGLSSSLGVLQIQIQRSRLLLLGFSTQTNVVKVKKKDHCSFTVSYLIKSCGLSPEIAKSVSKKVVLESGKRPDSILKILRNHGFSDSHIARLVTIRPLYLLANPDRIMLPKLEFFNSIGLTDAELASICASYPSLLAGSLDKLLIPNYNFLKTMLLSDENVIKAFKRKPRIFQFDLLKKVSPKLEFLRELGVPESFFPLILTCYSAIVLQSQDKFERNTKKVIDMGFDPRRSGFIHAMQVFVSKTQETLEHKFDVFKKLGWSEADLKLAFRRCPACMNASEKKITGVMNFLVNKMGWHPTDTATYPAVFLSSFQGRIIPRCSVIKLLQSKKMINEEIRLSVIMKLTDSEFLDRYVTRYVEDVPQLLNIYHGKESLKPLDMVN